MTSSSGALRRYGKVLRAPHVPTLLLVGFAGRLPHSVTAVLVTMHVTLTLGLDYASAGLAAALLTIGVAVGSPWRGRRIDSVGLRRAVVPSLVVEGLAWGIAPHVSYPFLLVLLFLAGLYALPVFTVVRQSLGVLMHGPDRRTAFSLDSMATELVFVIGPGGSAVLAARFSSGAALTVIGVLVVLAGVLLLVRNPPTHSDRLQVGAPDEIGELQAPSRPEDAPNVVPVVTGAIPVLGPEPRWGRRWLTAGVLAMFVMAAGAGFALAGTEVGVVAFSERSGDAGAGLWWAYAVWSAASLIGGFVYGLRSRRLDPLLLITVLGIGLLPAALAGDMFWLGLLLAISGFFIAPLMTAASERLTDLVAERHRGEAMGWYGSAMTAGTAIGTPLVGLVIDHAGAPAAFLVLAVVAILTGVATLTLRTLRRRLA